MIPFHLLPYYHPQPSQSTKNMQWRQAAGQGKGGGSMLTGDPLFCVTSFSFKCCGVGFVLGLKFWLNEEDGSLASAQNAVTTVKVASAFVDPL